jgi:hypothetical protein
MKTVKGKRWGTIIFIGEEREEVSGSTVPKVVDTAKSGVAAWEGEGGD